MSASISVSGFIKSSGVTVENEPIVKSDGSGEIMQWQPSDGGADGIYITESVEDGPAFIGIGSATQKAPLHIKMPGNNWEDSILLEQTGISKLGRLIQQPTFDYTETTQVSMTATLSVM